MKDEDNYSVNFEYKDGSVDEAADNVEDIIKNALDGEAEDKVLEIYKNLKGENAEHIKDTVRKVSKGANGFIKMLRVFVILIIVINVVPTVLFGVLTSIPEEKIETAVGKLFESDFVKDVIGIEESSEIEEDAGYSEIEGGDRVDKAHDILNSNIWNEDESNYEEIDEPDKKEEKAPLIDTNKLKEQATKAVVIAVIVAVLFIGVLVIIRHISIKKSKKAFGTLDNGLESDGITHDKVED